MMNEFLKSIGERIRTQDNRCTDAPIFIVQQKKRIYGIDKHYTDDCVWVDMSNDLGEITDEEEIARLEELEDDGSCGDCEKVGYVDTWEFVTACFTEQGCKNYLAINGHNLTEPRIYAAGSYRNNEFRAVRDFLKGLKDEAIVEQ
jgi:hypothetical protein